MGILYTGKGDSGKSIIGKKRVDKTCIEISSLGDLDELNSLLGAVQHENIFLKHKKMLRKVQENLFIIQANIAGIALYSRKFKTPDFPENNVKEIEKIIDGIEREIKPAQKFIIPGGTRGSAWLDLARAVSRRVEREILKVHKKYPLPPAMLAYLNRLSSLLFALARAETARRKKKETHPRYK